MKAPRSEPPPQSHPATVAPPPSGICCAANRPIDTQSFSPACTEAAGGYGSQAPAPVQFYHRQSTVKEISSGRKGVSQSCSNKHLIDRGKSQLEGDMNPHDSKAKKRKRKEKSQAQPPTVNLRDSQKLPSHRRQRNTTLSSSLIRRGWPREKFTNLPLPSKNQRFAY